MTCATGSIGALALIAALSATFTGAFAFDQDRASRPEGTPGPGGGLGVTGQPSFDQTWVGRRRPAGPADAGISADPRGQPQGPWPPAAKAPIRPSTRLSPNAADWATAYDLMEIVITPETTHILMEHIHDLRRDLHRRRSWPENIEPSLAGLFDRQWRDEDGSGRYTVLVVETRGFRPAYLRRRRHPAAQGQPDRHHAGSSGSRAKTCWTTRSPSTTMPWTRPWTVTKHLPGETAQRPVWRELACAENNSHVQTGGAALLLERRRSVDAGKEKIIAAGFEVLQSIACHVAWPVSDYLIKITAASAATTLRMISGARHFGLGTHRGHSFSPGGEGGMRGSGRDLASS